MWVSILCGVWILAGLGFFYFGVQSGEPVAAFTGWLAVGVALMQVYYLRGTLNATAISADAARRAVDINVAMDIPILDVVYVRPGASPQDSDRDIADFAFYTLIRNYGRTPAFTLDAITCVHVGNRLPDVPVYEGSSWKPWASIEGNNNAFIPDTESRKAISPREKEDVLAGTLTLWVYGRFRYRDILYQRHVFGWVARWDVARRAFAVLLDAPAYIYQRKEDRVN